MFKKKPEWTKISGAGNSFVVAHHPLNKKLSNTQKNQLIKYVEKQTPGLCNKHTTEGVVLLLPSRKYDFEWVFFNKDASLADMCGNAACCVASYVFKKNLLEKILENSSRAKLQLPRWFKPGKHHFLVFKTSFRVFVVEKLTNNKVQVLLPLNRKLKAPRVFKTKAGSYQYRYINTAVPHAVIKLLKWPKTRKKWEELKHTARLLRNKKTHHRKGMNVSFYSLSKKPGEILARTFERGVEDFTPACGTGAIATATFAKKQIRWQNPITVKMPGGRLKVSFLPRKTVALSSPVRWWGKQKT